LVSEPSFAYHPLFYQAMVDNKSMEFLQLENDPSPLVRSIAVFDLRECPVK